MPLTSHVLKDKYAAHKLSAQQQEQEARIWAAALGFAEVLATECPQSPPLDTSLRYVEIAAALSVRALVCPV